MSGPRTAGSKHHLRAMAFLIRSIRQDSRLVSHHVLRAAMPALILYIFFLQLELATRRGAGGGAFAGWVVHCCYWFLTLFGGLHFSTAIVEETEEETLPLLQMTGVSPAAILLGKSLPRLLVALLFLVVSVPFLTLALTLGGVLPLGLFTAMISLMVYAILLSQMGLLASVLSRSATQAFSLLGLFWLGIEFSHWWLWMLSINGVTLTLPASVGVTWVDFLFGTWNRFAGRLPELSLFGHLGETLLSFTAIDVRPNQSLWNQAGSLIRQVWTFRMTMQLALAGGFFLLSWLCFRSERIRTFVAEQPGFGGIRKVLTRSWRIGRASRVSSNALRWKSWQHVGGGTAGFLYRLVLLPVVICGASWIFMEVVDSRPDIEAIAAFAFFLGVLGCAINAFRLFGALINPEIHQKTLPALMMLPQSTSHTLRSLISGSLPAVLAGASTCVVSFLIIFLHNFQQDADEFIETLMQPWLWHVVSLFTLNLMLGLLLTTYFRYGGMVLAFVLILVAFFLGMFTLIAMSFAGSGPGNDDFFTYVIPSVLIIGELALCVVLWKRLIVRLDDLAAR